MFGGLKSDLVALAEQSSRYSYRKISTLLKAAGWLVNDKRVERIWRREGLKVPVRQPKRGRIWDNDGSCLRRRQECRNHVCSYDDVLCDLLIQRELPGHIRSDNGPEFIARPTRSAG